MTDHFVDCGTLDHDPAIAVALGNMVTQWARAETALAVTLARLTSIDPNLALLAYYRIPTFEARVKVIRGILTEWQKDGFDPEAIDRAVEKLSALSGARNHWVHGVWCVRKSTSETVLFDFRKGIHDKGRRKPVKAADIQNHNDAVSKRATDLRRTIKFHELFS